MDGAHEEDKDLEFRETKYPGFRVATGFKDGDGEVPVDNWLQAMEIGTVFLAMTKNPQAPLVEEYVIMDKTVKCVLLTFDDHRGTGRFMVSAEQFIKKMELVEILGKIDVSGSR